MRKTVISSEVVYFHKCYIASCLELRVAVMAILAKSARVGTIVGYDAHITSCAGGRHNMPPPPASWPFDLESGVRVT